MRSAAAAARQRRKKQIISDRRKDNIKSNVTNSFKHLLQRRKKNEPSSEKMSNSSSAGPDCSDDLLKRKGQDFQREGLDGSDRDGAEEISSNEDNQPTGGDTDRPVMGSDRRENTSKRTLSSISDKFMENIYYVKESETANRLRDARKMIGKMINNNRVQWTILALIVINAIMIGVATFPAVKDNPSMKSTFELVDHIFLIIFTIEAAMQLIYHGFQTFKDPWLVFDITIVVISWALDGVQVARAFRIFRALRLVARIDVMRNLIKALMSVIPNVTAIAMLLFLVFYIFGVMFTQLYKETSQQYEREEQYFAGLPETFFTLFQIMTLDEWAQIYEQAYEEYSWSWVLFIAFVVISAFIFANLVIAVICDAVHVLGDEEVAALIGVEEDQISQHRILPDDSLRSSVSSQTRKTSSNIQKLQEMELYLDQIVVMHDELKVAIELIAKSSNIKIPPSKIGDAGTVMSSARSSLVGKNNLDSFSKTFISQLAIEGIFDEESVSSQRSSPKKRLLSSK